MKIATAVLFSACLTAQKPATADELVVRRLANPDAAAADAAMVDLIRGGTANAPVLQRVLAATKDAAVRARVERALTICKVDAPATNGLKVGLVADRRELVPGQAITLTATVCNVTDRPVALYLGMSYSGNVLENGLALQQGATDGGTVAQSLFGRVGFCGTGAHAVVEVLPAWSSKQFALTATYREDSPPDGVIRHDGPHLAVAHAYLPLAMEPRARGEVRVRLGWTVDPKEIKASGFPRPAGDAKATDWQGALRSNDVVLHIGSAH
jgi:hypothetical protein